MLCFFQVFQGISVEENPCDFLDFNGYNWFLPWRHVIQDNTSLFWMSVCQSCLKVQGLSFYQYSKLEKQQQKFPSYQIACSVLNFHLHPCLPRKPVQRQVNSFLSKCEYMSDTLLMLPNHVRTTVTKSRKIKQRSESLAAKLCCSIRIHSHLL